MWFALLAPYCAMLLFFQHRLPSAWLAETNFEVWVSFVNGAVVYLLLFLIYLCLYFTDHSLTIVYAIELELRGQMTHDDIKRRFPYDAMLEQRLADLIANHYVDPTEATDKWWFPLDEVDGKLVFYDYRNPQKICREYPLQK